MPLHRLTVPTYSGGLPGTHDYINNPSANGDPGAPAPADNKKSSGVNQGTYFVSFGESATSSDANRGMKALAQNTDFLDDVIHKDLAQPVVSASATPGSPLASFVITGVVYVGQPGVTNDQRTRSGMVALLDGNGQPLSVLSGGVYVAVKASLIHDGASNNVLGNNFYTNPTVNLSPSIPTGQTYRYVYYARSSPAAIDQGALSRFNNGVANAEDVWAFMRTLDITVPKLASNNTFTGKQIFSFPSVDQPLLSSTIYSANRTQMWEAKVALAPDTFMRMYTRGIGSGGVPGIEITINARWDDSAVNWVADSTAYAATKFMVSGVFQQGRVRKYTLKAPAATFTDSTFQGDTYVWLDSGMRTQTQDATSILLQSDDSLTASYLINHYKQLLETVSGASAAGAPRIYATAIGQPNATDDYGVAVTNNAKWSTGSQQWVPDHTAIRAGKVLISANGLKFSARDTPGASFGDASWDRNVSLLPSSTSLGDLEYATAISRVKLLNIYAGMTNDEINHRWDVSSTLTDPFISCGANSCFVYYPIVLPYGSTLTRVRSIVTKGAAGDQMAMYLVNRSPMGFTLGPVTLPTSAIVAQCFTSGGAGDQIMTMTMSQSIVNDGQQFALAIQSTNTASIDRDFLYGIQLVFTDIGPSGR